jgi:Zn-dependent protease with chaperone function
MLVVVGFLAAVLAPLAAQLIRFAVSRQREYFADATAAQFLRDPQSMVDALRRLEEDRTPLSRFESANAHLWFEEPNDLEGRGRRSRISLVASPRTRRSSSASPDWHSSTLAPSIPRRPLRPVQPPPAPGSR